MREETEWVETVQTGWNRLVGLDADAAATALAELPPPDGEESPAAGLYGGGKAGERVSEAIANWLEGDGTDEVRAVPAQAERSS